MWSELLLRQLRGNYIYEFAIGINFMDFKKKT